MASTAKNIANKANAQRSTGPKTEAGKTASKYNRTRHGLAGKQVVIHGEDPTAYDALRTDLIEAYNPANAAELALVEEIAQNFWRLQRARSIEADTFNIRCAGADPVIGFHSGHREFDNLRRYMAAIERAYHRALNQLAVEQATRRKLEAAEAKTQAPSQHRPQPRIHVVPPTMAPPVMEATPPPQPTKQLPSGTHEPSSGPEAC